MQTHTYRHADTKTSRYADIDLQTRKHADTDLQTHRHADIDLQTHRHSNIQTQTHRHADTDLQTRRHKDKQICRHRPTDTQTCRHRATDTQTQRNCPPPPPIVRFSLHFWTDCRLREVIKHFRSKMTWPSRHMDVLMALSRETYNRRPSPPYSIQTSRSPAISRTMIPHFVDLLLHIRNWYQQSKQRDKWISPWNWKETALRD